MHLYNASQVFFFFFLFIQFVIVQCWICRATIKENFISHDVSWLTNKAVEHITDDDDDYETRLIMGCWQGGRRAKKEVHKEGTKWLNVLLSVYIIKLKCDIWFCWSLYFVAIISWDGVFTWICFVFQSLSIYFWIDLTKMIQSNGVSFKDCLCILLSIVFPFESFVTFLAICSSAGFEKWFV